MLDGRHRCKLLITTEHQEKYYKQVIQYFISASKFALKISSRAGIDHELQPWSAYFSSMGISKVAMVVLNFHLSFFFPSVVFLQMPVSKDHLVRRHALWMGRGVKVISL